MTDTVTVYGPIGKLELLLTVIARESSRNSHEWERLPGFERLPATVSPELRLDMIHGLSTGAADTIAMLYDGHTLEQRIARALAVLRRDGVLTDAQCADVLAMQVPLWLKLRDDVMGVGIEPGEC